MILAAPVAFVSGISRAARRGVIVKGGGALETLARGQILVLDKTGTVTGGAPVLTDVVRFGTVSEDEILRLAASLDQASLHVLAEPILRAARQRDLPLTLPSETKWRDVWWRWERPNGCSSRNRPPPLCEGCAGGRCCRKHFQRDLQLPLDASGAEDRSAVEDSAGKCVRGHGDDLARSRRDRELRRALRKEISALRDRDGRRSSSGV